MRLGRPTDDRDGRDRRRTTIIVPKSGLPLPESRRCRSAASRVGDQPGDVRRDPRGAPQPLLQPHLEGRAVAAGTVQSSFGPGTYTGGVVSGQKIGQDDFTGTESSVTINPDGSGSATFTDLEQTAGDRCESATMKWICSAS
jgi:hypothetical protein